MGLRTPAITANARPSRVGVSGRYPVIPPIKLPVLRTTENRCSCADFLPSANESHLSRTRRPPCHRLWYWQSALSPVSECLFLNGYRQKIVIGNPLKLSPGFPPLHTGHATFTASGVPSSIVSAVIHNHSFTLAKFATLLPVAAVLR